MAASMEHALPSIQGGASSGVPGSVSDFYAGKTIFITGGTGFMGKVLLEKLLRACPGVTRVYLLIRPKRGQQSHERLQQLLSSPLFDTIRKDRPADLAARVLPIEGDITQPELAISATDRQTLIRSVNVVFHSAATVKFDEKLKLSVTINMLGTQRLVELCKKMTHLEALVHVSTAYCNCDRPIVAERIYPPSIGPDYMTQLVDALDEGVVDAITPSLIGRRPNTYTFTKALAESWLKENRGDLPLVIVRPSIVLSSIDGPLKGWVDNWNGPTGIIAAAGKGVFRSMLCDPDKIADIVPVDMVINLMLTTAWRISTTKSKEVPIYNCCTGLRKPITWSKFIQLCFKYMRVHPFSDVTWYPDGTVTASALQNMVLRHLVGWLPAYLIDGAVYITGGKPVMVRIQEKLCKAAKCLEYFTTQQWQFEDDNVRHLATCLSESDRKEFPFDVAAINWENYIENYVLGIRRYIFKEDISTIPKARRQLSRLYYSHKLLQFISIIFIWRLLSTRVALARHTWRQMVYVLRMLLGRAMSLAMTVLTKQQPLH